MTSSDALPRRLLIFAIILPIAALVGFLLADPSDVGSLSVLAAVVGTLLLPVLLAHHHLILAVTWHASLIIIFLPGQPYLWMLMTAVSLGLTALNRILDPNFRIVYIPSVTWSLVFLAGIVFLTAQMTGGVGVRSLGANVIGGKKYYLIWFAIVGYFALSARPLKRENGGLLASLHFGSGVTAAVSTLAYVAGPAAWVLYSLFPTDYAMHLVSKDFTTDFNAIGISRYSGFSIAGMAVIPYLFIRWGARGLLDWTRPWRFAILLLIIGVSMLGGFRSTLGLFVLLFVIQFWNEGLFHSRYFPIAAGAGLIALVIVWVAAPSLPMSIQRSLSVIPLVPVSSVARTDAENSTKWRRDMWKQLEPEVMTHLWMGKGYTASQTTYRLEQEAYRMGMAQDYEMMILAGDYHSGWRSILIPFGVWGMLAFVLFVIAALRVLAKNSKKGEGWFRRTNQFLLSYFIAKVVFFFLVFGAIASDLFFFTGILGLSVSLNQANELKESARPVGP